MKKLILLTLLFGMTSAAFGEVSAGVYLFDDDTHFEFMVGTKLTIIVDSNVAEHWSGRLAIEGDHRNYGVLSGRGYNGASYKGSCLAAASYPTDVYACIGEPGIAGFDLHTGDFDIEVGDWFIIDYTATDVGDCNVGFYEFQPNDPFPPDIVLLYYLEFSHVRTRDFNNDTKVDFGDFAILASYWQYPTCADSNDCQGSDLDINGTVNANDLMLFCDYWLEKTEFRYVRTRDFNNDTAVDFGDFAILASYWQYPTCAESKNCQGSDLDVDGTVDANDLMLFTDYWLEKTE